MVGHNLINNDKSNHMVDQIYLELTETRQAAHHLSHRNPLPLLANHD